MHLQILEPKSLGAKQCPRKESSQQCVPHGGIKQSDCGFHAVPTTLASGINRSEGKASQGPTPAAVYSLRCCLKRAVVLSISRTTIDPPWFCGLPGQDASVVAQPSSRQEAVLGGFGLLVLLTVYFHLG